MKRTYLVLLVTLLAGVGLGLSVGATGALPGSPLVQAGGPLVPVGASGTGTVAWVLEPASRTIWACVQAPAPSCTKAQLP